MKKHLLIAFSCFLTLYTHAMEIEIDAMELAPLLPDDMIAYILQLSFPPIDLCYDQIHKGIQIDTEENDVNFDYTTEHLPLAATRIIELSTINTYFNNVIAQNITTWLNLNKDNINAFLIRSTQANIPYFIKIAIHNKANPNFVHKPNGYIPLLYAASANCYNTCKFLLAHKADVNLKMQRPEAWGYGYNPWCNWPIHIAVKKRNAKLVTLFAEKGAALNVRINNDQTYSLLAVAAEKNDPDTLAALLNACPITDYQKNWGLNGIDRALEILSRNKTLAEDNIPAKKECLTLLNQAQEQMMKYAELPMSENPKDRHNPCGCVII